LALYPSLERRLNILSAFFLLKGHDGYDILFTERLPQELDFYEKGSFLNFIIYLFLNSRSTNTFGSNLFLIDRIATSLAVNPNPKTKWHILNMNDRFFLHCLK
jgi:hypothetical protein